MSYNDSTNTLTLSEATIESGHEGSGVYYSGTEDLTIKLSSENKVIDLKYGIYGEDRCGGIIITGDGSFTLTGDPNNLLKASVLIL